VTPEVPLWRQRDFRIAWSAGFVNDTGDWVLNVALPIFVFIETGSGSATALLFVCQLLVGAVLGPFGGAIVDRVDLRRCLVATNSAQAVAVLPLLAVSQDRVWPAYVVVVAQAVLTQVNNPANAALIPRVIDANRLTEGNAALAASASLARLLGAPIGGLLVAWRGLGPIVVIDAASFLIVAASLSWLRADTSPRTDPDAAERGHVRAGLRTVRTHPPLARLLSIHGVAQIAQGGFVVLFVAFMVDELGDDGAALGLIRGTMAIGALVGSILIARLARHLHPSILYSAGLIGMGVVSTLFWNAPTVTTALAIYIVLFTLSGVPGSALTVGLFTTIHTRSPSHTIGRVVGLMGTAEALGSATGAIIAGILVDRVPLRPLLNAQAAIYITTGLLAGALIARNRAEHSPESAATPTAFPPMAARE
jgi:MFS family permease